MEIGVFEGGWSVSAKFLHSRGIRGHPREPFFCTDRPIMASECPTTLSLHDGSVYTKELCIRLSLSDMQFWTKKNIRFAFLSPLWGFLWLIRKRV